MSDKNTNGLDDADKARDLLRDAIESLTEGFALYDEDRRLVMFNKRYKEMNQSVADLLEPGLDWEILMRETARKGIYSEAIGQEDRWVSDRLENGVEYIQDYELTQTDGKSYLVSVHPTELGGFVVTKTDITQRKNAEIMEQDTELLIRTVLDASSAIATMARPGDGFILYRTPAALELLGNTKFASEHYVSREQRADFVTQILCDGMVNDYRLNLLNRHGEEFPATISARIVEYKGEEVIVTSVIDLTEQKKAEELIRQVLESCPAPIKMTKADTGELIYSSYDSTSVTTYRVDIPTSNFVEANGREKFINALKENGWLNAYKAEFEDRNGQRFWGSISANLIKFRGEDVIVSSTRDLTDEIAIQEELSSQREMLFQNEKMSALGELLAGVAHELNNPLSVVVGHSLMLQEEVEDDDLIKRIEKISGAAERCAKIVKTFLAMARQQPTRMEATDLNSVVETAVDVAGYGRPIEGLEISHNLSVDLPPVSVDPDQITQVIINLVLNAEQAIKNAEQGSLIKVSTSVEPDGRAVRITVEDDGPGIPEKIAARIFEPFFTTKEVGEGTGIGLAFCHRIVLSHKGRIWLDQDKKQGSRFVVSLPTIAVSEEIPAAEESESRKNTGVRILIVDDETDVGELNSEILRKEGFEVDFVNSGAAALKVLGEKRHDILLSDLNMPEIGGREIYEFVRDNVPELLKRTAIITGDSMGEASKGLLMESRLPHLEKPVAPAELRDLVCTMVDCGEVEG